MGEHLLATCECGFKKNVTMGASMIDYEENNKDYAPAYCHQCKLMFTRNLNAKYVRCSKCRKKLIFYHEPSMHQGDKSEFSYTMNLCPKCGKFTLKFITTIMFD